MSKRQRLIIMILAIGDVVVFLLLGAAILYGFLNRPAGPVSPSADLAAPPTPTEGLPPTWTPSPTSVPEASASPTPTPTPRPLTPEEAEVLDQVEGQVVALRGLVPLRPVARWVLNETQFHLRVAHRYQQSEEQEALQRAAIVLTAFDWLVPGTDIDRIWQGLLREQVTGFYDPRAEAIYLISNAEISDVHDQVVFAHELDHALQDQYFDLEGMGMSSVDWATLAPADRSLALRALVEGDAMVLQERYIEQVLTDADRLALQQELERAPHVRLDAAPKAVREMFLFPYTYGESFATALYEREGWAAINGAYAAPPTSTEQILHPDRYLAGDAPIPVPIPDLQPGLGDEWTLVHEGTLGEFWLRLYLENRLEPTRVVTATEGWGGDYGVVYFNRTSGETVLALRSVWDTMEDADEFYRTAVAYGEARFGRAADEQYNGWDCWDGESAALCVTWQQGYVSLVRGPNLLIVEALADLLLEE
ncbi:MAG TPA: hypothetical protein G4O00_14790 [Thermoflexia bacterium]|nr:hypothetical protein [Thermoflexia bacterium]